MNAYTQDFYKRTEEWVRSSAKEIVPLVMDLIKPNSVIDIGCGIGTWLAVFKEYGIEDILGVDGEWVDKKMLQIPEKHFISFDLKKPFQINKQFDLVISLEVAEHLPCECAKIFIDSLTKLGSVILFSAAIPFQGGTIHVNEQWPEFWVKYFQEKGYAVIDYLRKRVWQNSNVGCWYAQNILMFIKRDYLEGYTMLKKEYDNTNVNQLSIVHPKIYLSVLETALSDLRNMSLMEVLSVLPILVKKALLRRIKKYLCSQNK